MQRIRNERERNNYLINAEREYREAQELSEYYENKDREFKDNAPTFEYCETLRKLIIKEEERKEKATVEIEEITGKIKATEEEIGKLLKT